MPPFESPFRWATWDSTDVVLPESIHCDPAEYRKLLQFCQEWTSRSAEYLSFADRLTHFLLVSGLVCRELDHLLFQDDPDDTPYPLPEYTNSSLLTQRLLAGLSSTFQKLSASAEGIQAQNVNQIALPDPPEVRQTGKRKAAELTSPSAKTSPTTRRTKRDRIQTDRYKAFDPVVVPAKPSSRRAAATRATPVPSASAANGSASTSVGRQEMSVGEGVAIVKPRPKSGCSKAEK